MNETPRSVAIHLQSRQKEAANTKLFHNIVETFGDEIDLGSSMEADQDAEMSLELRTAGTLSEKNGRMILSYDETELTGMQGSTTQVSFSKKAPNLITMLRSGAVSTALVFEQGVRHICVYNTEVMPFEICIYARSVKNDLTMEGGSIQLDYLVEIHGAAAEHTIFTLDVKITDASM